MNFRQFIWAQSLIMMAGSMIFPFYVLLLRNVGDSYAQFGWAYGLFALTSALAYPVIGKMADHLGDKVLLVTYTWGTAVILLFFPLVDQVWQVYILQIVMGLLGALQKNTEKTSLARYVAKETAGRQIGHYHTWTSIAAAIAIILTGYIVDFLTIGTIFYLASIVYVISGWMLWKQKP
ncbi:MFS transporter [Bacillus badius]|uniref:Multidrug resistance protein B n=1 Tax=Bacillus badius TaxID=1455 RepID=A0ABR5ASG7_BACBA|nr:MFS transporter [Bacillus badius]KIL75571.1 Multidrug resistance protein B [Bacillus badius]KIL77704.1 Multidrug resistance protein B [Bacillus badius]KZR59293.1 MFS transporter [Bacillus badius]MED4715782.1 MFS transporter [Bacillus badius]